MGSYISLIMASVLLVALVLPIQAVCAVSGGKLLTSKSIKCSKLAKPSQWREFTLNITAKQTPLDVQISWPGKVPLKRDWVQISKQ